ncbi:MAG: hypothetical protein LCH54_13705 [Bacteroidetes bacterium]|nr:hypothetical protein [Bacteroidota bacterium]
MKFYLIALSLLISGLSSAQTLKEFDLQEMSEQQIPVFVEHPNEAALIFYTAINGFTVQSNTGGIVKIESEATKVTVFLKPERQILTLKAPGFIEKKLPVETLSAKQTKFYRVNGKEESYSSDKGSYQINTVPDGVMLKIDGIPSFRELTPFDLKEFEAKKYRLNLTKPDYYPLDTLIEIRQGIKQSGVFKLRSMYGTLSIKTPVAVKANLNDQTLDVGPELNNQRLRDGVYTLTVNDPRFFPYTENITILSGQTAIKEIPLKSVFGTLILKSAIPVKVKINDRSEDIGSEPKTFSLKIGDYTLSVNDPRVDSWTEKVAIGSGETKTLDLPLVKRVGYLQILHADGFTLTVGRETKSKKPGTQLIEFFEGSYLAEVKRPGFQPVFFPFTIKKGEVINWEPAFQDVSVLVKLQSDPEGATVQYTRNGETKLLGFTPLEEQMAVGEVEFLFKRDGYKDYQFKATFEEGKPFSRKINLANPDEFNVKNLNKKPIDKPGTLTYNGFTYTTVLIGKQEWTVENLRTTKYNDGTQIKNLTKSPEWTKTTSGAYCAYDDKENNVENYGYLYNWYAVNTRKLAPDGWRVPSNDDWDLLMTSVGGSLVAGNKLKAKSGWFNNRNCADDYGFCALPGGYCSDFNGAFLGLGNYGNWWSSTVSNESNAWSRYINYDYSNVSRNVDDKKSGFSVRLVRDVQ